MGWCRGSYIANEAWLLVRGNIPKKRRQKLAQEFIKLFSQYDADCWYFDVELVQDAGGEEFFKENA